MANYTKRDIIEKARELATYIAETEEVDFFKRAEEAINQNEKVALLMKSIKAAQKQAVNLQHYGKAEALKQAEDKIDKLLKELDEIPVVQEFKSSQTDVNNLLQLVSSTISKSVTEQIIESTGGNVLHGETGSKANQNSSCDSH